MSKMCGAKDNRLFESLSAIGVEKKQAAELQNLFSHCGYKTFAIDSRSDANLVICSDRCSATEAAEIVELAKRNSATVIILKTSGRESICQEIVQSHDSTTVDKRAYLLIFNNHLPKQHFVL